MSYFLDVEVPHPLGQYYMHSVSPVTNRVSLTRHTYRIGMEELETSALFVPCVLAGPIVLSTRMEKWIVNAVKRECLTRGFVAPQRKEIASD